VFLVYFFRLELFESFPRVRREKNRSRFLTFAQERYLADGTAFFVTTFLESTPIQLSEFRNSSAGSIKKTKHDSVAKVCLQGKDALNIGLRENSFCEEIWNLWNIDGRSYVENEISDSVAESIARIIQCAVQRRTSSVGATPTRQLVAPAGSNRSGSGGNEAVEAFDVTGRLGRLSEHTGRSMCER